MAENSKEEVRPLPPPPPPQPGPGRWEESVLALPRPYRAHQIETQVPKTAVDYRTRIYRALQIHGIPADKVICAVQAAPVPGSDADVREQVLLAMWSCGIPADKLTCALPYIEYLGDRPLD